jgi:heat shock protein 4
MASFLKRIKGFYEKQNLMGNQIVVAVPDYCSNVERQDYLDAIKISGMHCMKLINESTAIATCYGFEKAAEIEPAGRLVAFIDMGHSKTSISFAQISPNHLKVIYCHSDRNLGAR